MPSQQAIDEHFMQQAIHLAYQAMARGDEPFGAVLVKDGEVVFTDSNHIHSQNDLTAHAELALIRNFQAKTGIINLSDYTLYASGEPCLMCSGLLVMTTLGRLVYSASSHELNQIIGKAQNNPSSLIFDHSHYRPTITTGILNTEGIKRFVQRYVLDCLKFALATQTYAYS